MYDDEDEYYGGGWSRSKFKIYGILLLIALVGRVLWEWLFQK